MSPVETRRQRPGFSAGVPGDKSAETHRVRKHRCRGCGERARVRPRDLFPVRNRKFESTSLQRRVGCEPDFVGVHPPAAVEDPVAMCGDQRVDDFAAGFERRAGADLVLVRNTHAGRTVSSI